MLLVNINYDHVCHEHTPAVENNLILLQKRDFVGDLFIYLFVFFGKGFVLGN